MSKRGLIVLTPFPYSDLSEAKVRPAVVIAEHSASEDFVVAFISTNTERTDPMDVLIKRTDPHFARTGLKSDSVIRVAKLATLDRRIILGDIGIIDEDHMKQVKSRLKKLFLI
ncbi:MAG: type II toxin-antitoxin system PemK/MazF family toxin [Candidatus Paceibacterota bacterium]|jgi:mRNA interferase MazF